MGPQLQLLERQDWENKRCSSRNAVRMWAELMIPAGPRFNVSVLDMSATGFRIETGNYLDLGRRFFLIIPDFQSMRARVAWHDRHLYGCEFSQPLHPSVFTHIVEKFPLMMQSRDQPVLRTNTVPAE